MALDAAVVGSSGDYVLSHIFSIASCIFGFLLSPVFISLFSLLILLAS